MSTWEDHYETARERAAVGEDESSQCPLCGETDSCDCELPEEEGDL